MPRYGLHYELCRQSIAVMEEAGYGMAAKEIYSGLLGFSSIPLNLTGSVWHSMAALEGIASAVTGSNPKIGKILKISKSILPTKFDVTVTKLWGFASERVRHFRKGTPRVDQAEAKLVFSIACATCTFLLKTKDSDDNGKGKSGKKYETWLQRKNYGQNLPYMYEGKLGMLVEDSKVSKEFEAPDEIDENIIGDFQEAKSIAKIYKDIVEMYHIKLNHTPTLQDSLRIIKNSVTVLAPTDTVEPNGNPPFEKLNIPPPLDKAVKSAWECVHHHSVNTNIKKIGNAKLELLVSVSCAVGLFLLAPYVDS